MQDVNPLSGEVWDALLDPVVGREQGGSQGGGRRPVLIISTDAFNRLPHQLCVVVPLTSRDRGLPTQMRIEPPGGGLRNATTAMCDQPRTISLLRLKRRRGAVEPGTLQAAQRLVGRIIGI